MKKNKKRKGGTSNGERQNYGLRYTRSRIDLVCTGYYVQADKGKDTYYHGH
jgi:hypothetical protein